jgi:hypothetical protein
MHVLFNICNRNEEALLPMNVRTAKSKMKNKEIVVIVNLSPFLSHLRIWSLPQQCFVEDSVSKPINKIYHHINGGNNRRGKGKEILNSNAFEYKRVPIIDVCKISV